MDLRQHALEALQQIAATGPVYLDLGICSSVQEIWDKEGVKYSDKQFDEIFDPLFASWPDKSCSDAYPVGNWSMQPNMLFWAHYDNKRSMWDPETRYGKARLDLLAHCIKELS